MDDKSIPYAKLSKKQKRARNSARRQTWGAFSPVTRKPDNPRAYNRKKARRQEKGSWVEPFRYPRYACPAQAAPTSS